MTLLLLIIGTRWGSDGGIILLDYGSYPRDMEGNSEMEREKEKDGGRRTGKGTKERKGDVKVKLLLDSYHADMIALAQAANSFFRSFGTTDFPPSEPRMSQVGKVGKSIYR